MNRTRTFVFAGLLIAAAGLTTFLFLKKSGSQPPVTLKILIRVTPPEEADFVISQANSAKLKYDAAKKAGANTAWAKRLSIKPVPKTSLLEVQVGVKTKEEGRLLASAFMETLNGECSPKAEVTLTQLTLR